MKAFPVKGLSLIHGRPTEMVRHDGMDLRDYFAAKALEGSIASFDPKAFWNQDEVAQNCYKMADAMMKARNETT
jgi:hypothetical protein